MRTGSAGQAVGKVKLELNGQVLGEYPVVSLATVQQAVSSADLGQRAPDVEINSSRAAFLTPGAMMNHYALQQEMVKSGQNQP